MEFVWGLMLLTLLPADRKRRQSQLVKQLTTWEAELPTVSKDWHGIKNELQKILSQYDSIKKGMQRNLERQKEKREN